MSLDSNYSDNFKSDNFKQENSRTDLTSSGLQVNTNALSSSHSAVSWGAILAGTVAAAALSLILIILGAGFGMSSISVWSGQGISATTFGFTTIIWLAFTQIIAYGMGGYLAGRLRTKWVSVHTDEVYFRDTAHGFLTWALASLLCATLLASAIGAIVGGAAKAGTSLAGGAASAVVSGAASHMDTSAMKTSMGSESMGSNSSSLNPMNYLIGTLFRKDGIDVNSVATDNSQVNVNTNSTESETAGNFAAAEANTSSNDMSGNNATDNNTNSADSNRNNQTAEVASIFVNNMNAATLPASDVKYVGQLVSQQAGISQQEAEKRVAVTFAQMQQQKINAISQAKDAADKALSTTAYAALWGFVFLLVGAFSASLAATWGGRSRDN